MVASLRLVAGRLRVKVPVRHRVCYRPVLAALARVSLPVPLALLADAREVHPHAVLAARAAIQPLAFDGRSAPGQAVSGLFDAVQGRFGAAALDFARVLRRRWMGREIVFQAVPV